MGQSRPLPSTALNTPAPRRLRVSTAGWMLSTNAMLLAASAFRVLRFQAAGLLVHPVNFGTAVMFLLLAPTRLAVIPARITLGLALFFTLTMLSTLFDDGWLWVFSKLLASLVTMVAAAMGVKNEQDFRTAAMAFVLAIAAIALPSQGSLDPEAVSAINPLQGIGSKNVFSMYALPALLLGSFYALHPATSRVVKAVLVAAILIIVLTIFSTGNRSGWLGIIFIAGVLSIRALRRVRTLLLLGAVVALAGYITLTYGNVKVMQIRLEETRQGYASDQIRLEILDATLKVAINSPLLGASPQRLPFEIARVSALAPVDAHNVFAAILGGSGFLTFFVFLYIGWVMWKRPRWWKSEPPGEPAREAHFLLRAMVALWCVRGMFSQEILYTPAFSLGVGMCLGLAIARGVFTPNGRRV